MDQTAYEVFGDASGWHWRLHDGDVDLAVAGRAYDSPEEARDSVERIRAGIAALEGDTLFDANRTEDEPMAFHLVRRGDYYTWHLRDGEELLAVPPATYGRSKAVREGAQRMRSVAVGSLPVYFGGSEGGQRTSFTVGVRELRRAGRTILSRGPAHQRFLDNIDTRIVVMGIRGKSSTTRRIGDVFDRRGYDTLVKITGNRPHLLHNGEYIPIERRGNRVTLYENVKTFWRFIPLLDQYDPDDVVVFENQGLTEYTTRLVNERFVRPHVVVLTNVRQDHQDTLGKTRRDIARSFARAVPEGTHVVSGEQHPVLNDYLRREVEKGGGTFEQVSIPDRHRDKIGAETVHAVRHVLERFDEPPLPETEVDTYLEAIQPRWTNLPGGRLYNAAEVNDIESTEAARRALAGDSEVLPFVYLRGDRRSRTASFANYLNNLAGRDLISKAHACGDYTDVFAANVDVPVIEHDAEDDPVAVLDALLDESRPVVVMGNTVVDFMRDFETEIERLARVAIHESIETPPVPMFR